MRAVTITPSVLVLPVRRTNDSVDRRSTSGDPGRTMTAGTSPDPPNTAEAVGGPYFEQLTVGQRFDGAPSVTLTDGQAAVHQAILGDRLRLPLDHGLAAAVAGAAPLAHPALVWNVAIGQSTLATHHVIANLFYRGLVLRRFPLLGDTLRTTTEVVGLRENRVRPGRPPTGLVAFRVDTVDQHDRPVLRFWRCAMLPISTGAAGGPLDDLDTIGSDADDATMGDAVSSWNLAAFRERVPGSHFDMALAGRRFRLTTGDVVSSASELARLTLNIAAVHHDAPAGGRRLVYGGHTIGLAFAQTCRALPNLVTVAGWHGCDHVGPVFEGDTLTSEVHVEQTAALASGGGLVHLRVLTDARDAASNQTRPVLDWRFVGVLA